MNRADAKRIADTVTREQLAAMFDRARAEITDWTKASPSNPVVTLGFSWNRMWPVFKKGDRLRYPVIKSMILTFGDYLPDELKPPKKSRLLRPIPVHQEPRFD